MVFGITTGHSVSNYSRVRTETEIYAVHQSYLSCTFVPAGRGVLVDPVLLSWCHCNTEINGQCYRAPCLQTVASLSGLLKQLRLDAPLIHPIQFPTNLPIFIFLTPVSQNYVVIIEASQSSLAYSLVLSSHTNAIHWRHDLKLCCFFSFTICWVVCGKNHEHTKHHTFPPITAENDWWGEFRMNGVLWRFLLSSL